MVFPHSRRRALKLFVLAGLMLGCLVAGAYAEAVMMEPVIIEPIATEPVSTESLTFLIEMVPDAVQTPMDVEVVIRITNNVVGGDTITVTLLDPNGHVCDTFGTGGSALVPPGETVRYQGNWAVSELQIAQGSVTYTARYWNTDMWGVSVMVESPISAKVGLGRTDTQTSAQLNVERFIEPGEQVVQGQTVTIRYTLTNAGAVGLKNITIYDTGVAEDPSHCSVLPAGQTAELSYQYVADSRSRTTKARVSYQYEQDTGFEPNETINIEPPVTIEAISPDILVMISEDWYEGLGNRTELKYSVFNNSSQAYTQLRLTDALLGEIDAGLSLGVGDTLYGTKEVTVTGVTRYQFTVTATDETGATVQYPSNELYAQAGGMDDGIVQILPVTGTPSSGGPVVDMWAIGG